VPTISYRLHRRAYATDYRLFHGLRGGRGFFPGKFVRVANRGAASTHGGGPATVFGLKREIGGSSGSPKATACL